MAVVAISGQPGCGSTTIGKMLAERLDIEFFSLGKWNKEQLRIIEGRSTSNETQDSIEMWRNKRGSSDEFHNTSDIKQKEIAAKGNVVIDAKLGIHMLRGFADFSVWLKAAENVRAERYAKRDGTDIKEALKSLKEKEKLERENWKRIYGFDYFEQEEEADIVIDVGNKTPEQITQMILKEMKKKELV